MKRIGLGGHHGDGRAAARREGEPAVHLQPLGRVQADDAFAVRLIRDFKDARARAGD